jgi:hypothetical protein
MKTTNALFGILTITLALSAQVQAQSFLTNGLVAYYPFNGDFSDASGNGNDGEIVGNDWQFGYRFATSSALFLNTNDPVNNQAGTYVAAPTTLDFNGDFTLSVWVNITNGLPLYHVHNLISDGIDSTCANFRIISDADTNGDDYLQFVSGQTNGELVDIHAFVPPLRNTWWQAVVVRSGTNLSLFTNGTLVTATNSTATLLDLPEIWLGSMPLSADETPFFGEYPLDGGIADVRMYGRALSASEVQQVYAYEFPTATVTLIADPTNGGVLTGSGTFTIGSQVEVSATANDGWTFNGWNDGSTQNPRTITVPSNDVAYVASFVTNTAVVTLIAAPSDGGTVSGGGTFEIGSEVQITATANTGWMFTEWNDGDTQNPRTITVPLGGSAYAAGFEFVPTSASYSGLFYDTNGIAFQSSGFFSLTLMAKGTFTAKLLLAGETYPFSGSFSDIGSASNSVSISKTNRLTILLGFDSGGRDILNGQISGGDWTAELVANRAVYSKTNLAPQMGKYTVLIPGSPDASAQPGGDGFGSVTVDHYGNLSFSGTLGDGTSASQSAVVSGQGQWPLYVSLYSGKGSILGWLTFANEQTNDIEGAPVWIKLPQPTAKVYPAGFTNQIPGLFGSLFQFTNGVPVLDFAAGELWLTNGNLAQSFTNQFVLGDNNKVTSTNKMSLTILSSSGLFTGSVVNPETKKMIPIHGAVLQKQNIGAGYFLGTNESGAVFLGPIP